VWNMIIPKEKLKKLPIRKPAISCFSVPIVLSPQKAQKSQKSRSHLLIFSVFDSLAPAHISLVAYLRQCWFAILLGHVSPCGLFSQPTA